MKKKIVLWIGACSLLSVGIVITLILMSGILKDQRNSFLRIFPPNPVLEGDTLNLRYNSYYIAGGTPHTVYLGNTTAPLHLLSVNLSTLDTQRVRLKVNGIDTVKFWSIRIQVDSPFYYVTDGAVPIIFKGDVHTWVAERFLSDSIYFRSIIPLRGSSFVVKSLGGTTNENMLGKIMAYFPYYTFNTALLEKQVDGIFCTDGMLHYDHLSHRVVYLYYYRNTFLVMDTSLTTMARWRTIDTTSQARIKPKTIHSTNTRKLASPPYLVNKASDASDNRLFVHSALQAHNEATKSFQQYSVIDVYTLADGQYHFSFYIYPFSSTKKMGQFRVFGNTLVVLYEDLIRVNRLSSRYFASGSTPVGGL